MRGVSILSYSLMGISFCLLLAVLCLNRTLRGGRRRRRRLADEVNLQNKVRDNYDNWTEDGILEHYWGEHIHLGLYNTNRGNFFYPDDNFWQAFFRATFALLKNELPDFKLAKIDFVDRMLNFANPPDDVETILDVGCGIGGSTRILARKYPRAEVIGISLSREQIFRARELTQRDNLKNCSFEICDAQKMPESWTSRFSLVWSCESGEHMTDKKIFVDELVRVTKTKGTIVLATWCVSKAGPQSLEEHGLMEELLDDWAHPYFIPLQKYKKLFEFTGECSTVQTADWADRTHFSWRHSIFVGMWKPFRVMIQPSAWTSVLREITCLERFHEAFRLKLMLYGMLRTEKR